MNDLNQIILEGEVTHTDTGVTPSGIQMIMMTVVSRKTVSVKGEAFQRVYTFSVEADGSFAKADIKSGDKVRIVGYLKSINGKVYIHTEHLERRAR